MQRKMAKPKKARTNIIKMPVHPTVVYKIISAVKFLKPKVVNNTALAIHNDMQIRVYSTPNKILYPPTGELFIASKQQHRGNDSRHGIFIHIFSIFANIPLYFKIGHHFSYL